MWPNSYLYCNLGCWIGVRLKPPITNQHFTTIYMAKSLLPSGNGMGIIDYKFHLLKYTVWMCFVWRHRWKARNVTDLIRCQVRPLSDCTLVILKRVWVFWCLVNTCKHKTNLIIIWLSGIKSADKTILIRLVNTCIVFMFADDYTV